jgi:hypothetical protein
VYGASQLEDKEDFLIELGNAFVTKSCLYSLEEISISLDSPQRKIKP